MDSIENKLNSQNPILVAQVISGLVRKILEKPSVESPEFKYLTQKSYNESRLIRTTSANGIIYLIKHGAVDGKSFLKELLTVIATMRQPGNLIYLVNKLLLEEINWTLTCKENYKCSFNLQNPQHPFITILMENPKLWHEVYNDMKLACFQMEDRNISFYIDAYQPLFFYVLCDPDESKFDLFKERLWFLLLDILTEDDDLFKKLINWMQWQTESGTSINTNLLLTLASENFLKPNVLLLLEAALFFYKIYSQQECRDILTSMTEILSLPDVDFIIQDPLLLILGTVIPDCSVDCLSSLIDLVIRILDLGDIHWLLRNILNASLLQWMANPTLLTTETTTVINKLLLLLNTKTVKYRFSIELQEFIKNNCHLLNANNKVYETIKNIQEIEKFDSETKIIKWLRNLNKASTSYITKSINILYGLLLTDFDDITIYYSVLDLIMKCSQEHKLFNLNNLTLFLYKLSNTKNSELQIALLKSLPKTASIKYNIHKIINVIQALNNGSGVLQTLSCTLMFELWKIDNKCYHYLENCLTTSLKSDGNEWEFYATNVYILKELCYLNPQLYGKDMVPHLSKILNECNHPDGELATFMALEGITNLCKFEIIDAVTTWASLKPMFENEKRVKVIKGLCGLIAEIPHLSYSEAYPFLTKEVINALWTYLRCHSDVEIWQAALDALSSFNVADILLQIPENFLDEESINDAKPDQTPSGQQWITFFKNCNSSTMPLVGDFFIKMISIEIQGYLKYVYQVKGTKEPIDFSYLPANSFVKILGAFIKTKAHKWKTEIYRDVYVECLRVFSEEYSKPLPPLDWCFLQELIHDPSTKNYCIDIACHQVILSGTARRLIENYIATLTNDSSNDESVLRIYKNLKFLANSIQPITLRPFLEVSVNAAVELFENDEPDRLTQILGYFKETLKNKEIQEINKSVIAEILILYINDVDISSKLFELVLDCVILFPPKYLDLLSSPKAVSERTTDWFRKAIKIKTFQIVNLNRSCLNYLNDLIDIGSSFKSATTLMFESLTEVFLSHVRFSDCALWLLDFLGKIQAAIAQKDNEEQIIYEINIFMLAVVVFSGHFMYLSNPTDTLEILELFPQALGTLLDLNQWSICIAQALDWLHFMIDKEIFPKKYKEIFKSSLQCLKYESEFKKNMKWMKYVNVEFFE